MTLFWSGSTRAFLQGGATHLCQHARASAKDLLLYCLVAWRRGRGGLQRELHQTPPSALQLHRRRRRGGGAPSTRADPLPHLQRQVLQRTQPVGGGAGPFSGSWPNQQPLDPIECEWVCVSGSECVNEIPFWEWVPNAFFTPKNVLCNQALTCMDLPNYSTLQRGLCCTTTTLYSYICMCICNRFSQVSKIALG